MKLEGTKEIQFHEVPEQDRLYSKTKNARLKFAICQKSTKLPKFLLKRSIFQSLWWNTGANLKIAGHVEQYALDLNTRRGRSLRKKLPAGN